MMFFKRFFTMIIMLLSSSLWAGAMGPICNRGHLTLPCDGSAWDFGLAALYLRPELNQYSFITVVTNGNGASRAINLAPSYGFGFKAEGSYHFDTGNDINVNWSHFNDGPYGVFDFNGYPGVGIYQAEALRNKYQPKWNAVNGEFGQKIFLSDLKPVRIHGGMQYMHMSIASSIQALNPNSFRRFMIKFQGVGPRLGADATYGWANGLAVHANGAGALLLGRSSFDHLTSGFPFEPVAFISGSQNLTVPGLEGKLGASYTVELAQGTINLDAGWLWYDYIDPVGYVSITSNVHGTTILSNFSLSGPYLELKWKSDV